MFEPSYECFKIYDLKWTFILFPPDSRTTAWIKRTILDTKINQEYYEDWKKSNLSNENLNL